MNQIAYSVSISGVRKVTQNDTAIIASTLRAGGVVVLRTDTIYGIVASADNQQACDKVFELKQRNTDKACIVLIADDRQMWDGVSRAVFADTLPRLDDTYPCSVIVPVGGHTPSWIHHGDQTVAFRVPHRAPWLVQVLRESGPIIAPSANPQGEKPAKTIDEAIAYFGDGVDLYVDGGEVPPNEASHIYKFTGTELERLR